MSTFIPIPSGAIAWYPDGRVVTLDDGTHGVATDQIGPAGFTPIANESVRATALGANDPETIATDHAPILFGTLTIHSLDPLILTDDGTGALEGDIGSGTNAVDLGTGRGTFSFNADAAGPILVDYAWLGTGTGTVFTLIGPADEPLGEATITLSSGSPMVSSATSNTLPAATIVSLEKIVDPAPSAQTIEYTDPNLDAATLAVIMGQIEECSELWQHELSLTGRNIPWVRRGSALAVQSLHDETGAHLVLPLFTVQSLQLDYDENKGSHTRSLKALAWTPPDFNSPPTTSLSPSGDALTFTLRGDWQPLTSYDFGDVVAVGQMLWAALLSTPAAGWTYPATSGSTLGLTGTPREGEGMWVQDGGIRSWYGVHQVVTLTGSVSGQTLWVRDRSFVNHYLTYYPSVGVWTDTPEPPS